MPLEQPLETHLSYPLRHFRPAHSPPPFRAVLKPDRSRATKTGHITSRLHCASRGVGPTDRDHVCLARRDLRGRGLAPAGLIGVLNDAIAFYFDDAAFAHAFVARFCCGYRVEAVEGAFALRNDTPPL